MTFEVIGDAFLDTLKVFPFMLIIYILIEILEHRTSLTQNKNILQGSLAPLIGSATGIVPQCGFSVMAAKLYDKGFIRTGTLLAVFVAFHAAMSMTLLLSSAVKRGSGRLTDAVSPTARPRVRFSQALCA